MDSRLVEYWRPTLHIDAFQSLPLDLEVQIILPPLCRFRHYVRDHGTVLRALKELIHFVSNLRMFPKPDTIFAQLKAIYPIRYWLHWAPGLVEQICASDPLAAVFQAHFHMVVIAVMPYYPAAVRCFALSERCDQIEALWQTLRDFARTSTDPWASDLEALMEGPRLIASRRCLAKPGTEQADHS